MPSNRICMKKKPPICVWCEKGNWGAKSSRYFNSVSKRFYPAKCPVLCPPFSRHGPPKFTLSDTTHIGGLIFMEMQLDSFAVPGQTWVEVLLRCLYHRDNTSTWAVLTGETVKSRRLTVMGAKVMHAHLTMMGKMVQSSTRGTFLARHLSG